MKILLDECVTKRFKKHLEEFVVFTVRELGLSGVKNGKLMTYCVENNFDILLTIRNNPDIVQGLLSISDYNDHYYLHLIESSPFNLGKNKLYDGVPGNLFAFTCKSSWDKGYLGFVSFTSKTRLIEHYEKTLGANTCWRT